MNNEDPKLRKTPQPHLKGNLLQMSSRPETSFHKSSQIKPRKVSDNSAGVNFVKPTQVEFIIFAIIEIYVKTER